MPCLSNSADVKSSQRRPATHLAARAKPIAMATAPGPPRTRASTQQRPRPRAPHPRRRRAHSGSLLQPRILPMPPTSMPTPTPTTTSARFRHQRCKEVALPTSTAPVGGVASVDHAISDHLCLHAPVRCKMPSPCFSLITNRHKHQPQKRFAELVRS